MGRIMIVMECADKTPWESHVCIGEHVGAMELAALEHRDMHEGLTERQSEELRMALGSITLELQDAMTAVATKLGLTAAQERGAIALLGMGLIADKLDTYLDGKLDKDGDGVHPMARISYLAAMTKLMCWDAAVGTFAHHTGVEEGVEPVPSSHLDHARVAIDNTPPVELMRKASQEGVPLRDALAEAARRNLTGEALGDEIGELMGVGAKLRAYAKKRGLPTEMLDSALSNLHEARFTTNFKGPGKEPIVQAHKMPPGSDPLDFSVGLIEQQLRDEGVVLTSAQSSQLREHLRSGSGAIAVNSVTNEIEFLNADDPRIADDIARIKEEISEKD